ncbi:hypothetical protein SAMN02799625_04813 [Methylobacterium sp. UNC300MFChir4.1]|uniref:hypothetical protein n=1 Tax=Methylobacterium sp. UNC300MFChir4.1 TaxID=1502747 RepID=UPI0008BA5F0A|nr:hypothetical protein [Methylobacterium sp. UNC300MFChir4.1]SEP14968.1 hypothetical protein SAMN02799625_04813 [Methylobacterium sp. UNC300MFChir4.1]
MIRGFLGTATLGALSLALITPLAAQTRAPDQTGTGGGPASTITAPNTNSLGVTKPPGTSLGPGEVPTPEQRRRERALTDKIEGSICDGCN